MNCDILSTLYVKSNGEILCNDDFGERVSLGSCRQSADDPDIHQTLNNDRYQNIREALKNDRTPWPEVCENCSFFRPDEPYSNDLLQKRIIQKIQIEASLACALKCPECSNLIQIKTRSGGRHFTPEMMADLLGDLKENHYQIRSIEYCGQGEPLNNPRFPELLATARKIYPDTLQRVITNGNHDFAKTINSEYVEETVVAIDGAFQESYEKYRVKGSITKAFKFLNDAIACQKPKGGIVVWKYVLFETNDSERELLEAQRLGDEFGVTRLWFVHSHTGNRSKKYTYDNPHTIPIQYSNVKIDSHPSYFRHAITIIPDELPHKITGNDSIKCTIAVDRVVIHENGSINISGWANSQTKLSHVTLEIEDQKVGDLAFVVRRPDAGELYPVFSEVLCGFDSLLPPSAVSIKPGQVMNFHLCSDQDRVATFALAPQVKVIVPSQVPNRISGDNSVVCLMHIDQVLIYKNGSIRVSGWANSQAKLSHVTLEIEDQKVGDLTFTMRRPIINELHPVFTEVLCGFDALLPPSAVSIKPGQVMNFHLCNNQDRVATFTLDLN